MDSLSLPGHPTYLILEMLLEFCGGPILWVSRDLNFFGGTLVEMVEIKCLALKFESGLISH